MRVSNIQHYLGGADQVVAKEVLEGNQFTQTITTAESVDFSDANTTFTINTELFTASTTNQRSSLTINNLAKDSNATVQSYTKTDLIRNAGTDTFDLLVPSDLLSKFDNGGNTFTSSPDSATPYVVVMKVQWTSGEDIKSLRFLFVIRYQPKV